jgi:hypothetical protein
MSQYNTILPTGLEPASTLASELIHNGSAIIAVTAAEACRPGGVVSTKQLYCQGATVVMEIVQLQTDGWPQFALVFDKLCRSFSHWLEA